MKVSAKATTPGPYATVNAKINGNQDSDASKSQSKKTSPSYSSTYEKIFWRKTQLCTLQKLIKKTDVFFDST